MAVRSRFLTTDTQKIIRATILLLVMLLACVSAPGQDVFEGVNRVVAVGDVHGGLEDLVDVLRTAHLIDGRNRWTGGNTHLVQTGDLLDRGPDSRKVMDLLMDLEQQAKQAGGMVHVLLGNHETMNLNGDLRYVTHDEFESYKTSDSARVRSEAYEALADPAQKQDRKYRKKWEDEHPLGWAEHRAALSGAGRYGQWLRKKNAVEKIGDALFAHGGISPKYVSLSLREINSRIRAELENPAKQAGGIVLDPQGPLWYRGLAEAPESTLAPHVEAVLSAFAVKHIVIAHTPTPGVIFPRFDGKVILIDVGLSKAYGEARACFLMEDTQLYALHRGSRVQLPSDGDVVSYLRRVEFLEPSDSQLRRFITRVARGQGSKPD